MASEIFVDVSVEVQTDIDSSRTVVEKQFSELVEWILEPEKRRLWDVEAPLVARLRSLGCALLTLWFATRRPTTVPRYLRGPDGRLYRRHDSRRTTVKTMVGAVSLSRDFYIFGQGRHGETLFPLDRDLGLQKSGFSLRAICMAGFLCAKLPFADARGTLQRFWGWAPATKSLLKMTDQLGPLARPFLEAQPAPAEDGEILYVLADSKGAPMITDTEMSRRRKPHSKRPRGERKAWRRRRTGTPRKRRKKGDKSKNAKMANVGVIYTLNVKDGVVEGPIDKRVYATFRNMEHLMQWLLAEAIKRGYGTKRTIFLADGDRKIWKQQERYFPLAECCLDYFHVSEKVWSLGEALLGEGSDQLADWVNAALKDLKVGRIRSLLMKLEHLQTTLPKSGPGTRGRRSRMKKGIAYLKKNQRRMPYAKLRRAGLDIGSGSVEGAVRQLGLRLDGPGMRWSPARAEHVLQLRCIVINGMWSAFEDYVQLHAHEHGLPARSPEGLGTTHNAHRKRAA